MSLDDIHLEKSILEKGSQLLKMSQDQSWLTKNLWYKKTLLLAMSRAKLKTALFRFIDVLPSLSEDQLLSEHFREYFKEGQAGFLFKGIEKLPPVFLARQIRKQISSVAKLFIVGQDIPTAVKTVGKNWEKGLAFSMDILGEDRVSEVEASLQTDQYLLLMESLLKASKNWPQRELLQKDSLGIPIPSVNISIKASSLYSQIRTEAWETSKKCLKQRLRVIFQKAAKDLIHVCMDMEQYHYKDLFLEIFKELLMEPELKNYPHFGIAIQAYLKDSAKDLKGLIQFAKQRGETFTIRWVKGAYWDSEMLSARQKNWPIPVYSQKEATDANFESCAKELFKSGSGIRIAIGSHNPRSIACALALHERYPKTALEFQSLYGMSEALAEELKSQSYCVRLYCGMGELIPGMSYLVRRLLENSSSQSFILNSLIRKKPDKELLAPPLPSLPLPSATLSSSTLSSLPRPAPPRRLSVLKKTLKPVAKNSANETTLFKNHPLMDFSRKDNREAFQKALSKWQKKLPEKVPILLEGKELSPSSSKVFTRENPWQKDQIISQSFWADQAQAERAVKTTTDFFKTWRFSPAEERIRAGLKLARLMQEREFELSALQVFEVGKSWAEAQADVAEAIDFCNYYALQYQKLIQRRKTDEAPGEESFVHFEPVGPAAIIAPWNFPLAILTGMSIAPLLCGNPILIKPAEQSPLTALQLARLLLKSGFPKQSFAFLPGKGEELGAYLVSHPETAIISFTGSLETGKQILENCRKIAPAQREIKKLVVEMGGKNALIIDSSADLDSAVRGVLSSAFAFQGQKCSALSRLILLKDVYDPFMKRFLPAVKSLTIDRPKNPRSDIGPLIDEAAFQKTKHFIANEKSKKLFEGLTPGAELNGYFLKSPVVYLADSSDSPLATEELFAPILACFKVEDMDQALELLNKSWFGLTAGLYSRHPAHIEKFKSRAEAGNLYINRSCTGALVRRHPFGGRKMSGMGSKTGGPDYLKHFLNTKIQTENTMRRGFAPEIFEEDFTDSHL